jgi:hypothetical protein
MFRFLEQVLRRSVDAEEAASATLGAAWSAVKTDCASYIRRVAG